MANLKALREKAKTAVMNEFMAMLRERGEDIGLTGTNEFCYPIVHEDGSEDFIVVKVSIPTGTRDGKAYDGYAMRDSYAIDQQAKAEKAAKAAEAKAKKIARDAANRERLAASKAAHVAPSSAE